MQSHWIWPFFFSASRPIFRPTHGAHWGPGQGHLHLIADAGYGRSLREVTMERRLKLEHVMAAKVAELEKLLDR
jgi:hypothetical protein